MNSYRRRIEERQKESMKNPLNRLNHEYSILCARRSRMSDDDPRKNGEMLDTLRDYERRIREYDTLES